ncbi:MAG: CubicO group peptidase (beta-lactamase class C family) [Rhodothermales bacterium]|jgi:CubicO group peptidase (beta-lactamase class C family)
MKRLLLGLAFIPSLFLASPQVATAQQQEDYDYWRFNRDMIQQGVQAILQCNGLFTSGRSLEQVFDDELKYLQQPVGTARGGDYEVDRARRAVTIGAAGGAPPMRAAFREGIGCVILAPDQTYKDIDSLPELTLPYPAVYAATTPWPMGDLINPLPGLDGTAAAALQAAANWAFDRPTPEQRTISLLVIHKGKIVHERYADGFDVTTRTRTWSTAKSIGATLIGMLVDEGKLELDGPLNLDWLPRAGSPETDPRHEITLRHLLNMSSGLYPLDNQRMEYATGSGLSYWAGASSVNGALSRALIRAPGTNWDYENYDTILAVNAMKRAIGDDQAYLEFPRRRLLDKLGMRNTLLSTDRFGDFIMSSQIYTNARDLGRFGMLYLNRGMWNGERLISEEWVDFVTTPAPASASRGNFYGGQFWLVPDNRTDVPKSAYSTAGNRGQFAIIVPTHDLVIVRRGLDYGRQGFDRWDLAREVLKAFPEASGSN